MIDPPPLLSPAGRQRQAQILALTLRHAGTRRLRRVIARSIVTCVAIAALTPLIVHALRPSPKAPVAIAPGPRLPTVEIRARPTVVRPIETDPAIIRRLAVKADRVHWRTIDDDQLLAELKQANRPAALAYVGGKPMLLFRGGGGLNQ